MKGIILSLLTVLMIGEAILAMIGRSLGWSLVIGPALLVLAFWFERGRYDGHRRLDAKVRLVGEVFGDAVGRKTFRVFADPAIGERQYKG